MRKNPEIDRRLSGPFHTFEELQQATQAMFAAARHEPQGEQDDSHPT